MATEYVVVSESQKGYWSNELGWVYEVAGATRWTNPVHKERVPSIGVADARCIEFASTLPTFEED